MCINHMYIVVHASDNVQRNLIELYLKKRNVNIVYFLISECKK